MGLVLAELRFQGSCRCADALEMERHLMHIKSDTASINGVVLVTARNDLAGMNIHRPAADCKEG
jgi:hypothetical protein